MIKLLLINLLMTQSKKDSLTMLGFPGKAEFAFAWKLNLAPANVALESRRRRKGPWRRFRETKTS